MANIKRIGYGQVEPNHLSAQRTGQIYAQLPYSGSLTALENGQFLKYDLANNACNTTGAGEWMLVYNEIKLYDERKQTYKDYAMIANECVEGVMVPRLFKTNIGDIYTTNFVGDGSATEATVGNYLKVDENGRLVDGTADDVAPLFQIAKVYTLADGQDAIKVVRVK